VDKEHVAPQRDRISRVHNQEEIILQNQPQDSMAHWTRSMEEQMETQRGQLRARHTDQIAHNSGAHWEQTGPDEGLLSLTFFQTPLVIQVPEYKVLTTKGDSVSTMTQGLVTAYLLAANGVLRAGEWIAFRELPGGMFYHQAFSGYSGGLLARRLGDNLEAFNCGAKAIGGRALTGVGDAAYEFRVLPRIWLAVVYWLGDEEDGFPPRAHVLFDRAASHYMILDGLAIMGSQLTRRIISAAQA
jgi:hypothetical protein